MSLILYERLQILIAALLIALATSWVAWMQGYYFFPFDKGNKHMPFWYVLCSFGLFLLAEMFFAPLLFILGLSWEEGKMIDPKNFKLDSYLQGIMNLTAIAASAISLGIFCYAVNKNILHEVFGENAFISWKRRAKDFLLGSMSWAICYPLIVFIGQAIEITQDIFYQVPHVEQVAVKHLRTSLLHPQIFWITVFAIIFVVPVIEEMLFRGFLQSWLTTLVSKSKAIIITSIIFATFHFSFSQKLDNIELLISLFLLSCYLGFLYERQKSLFAPIGLHITFNAVSIFLIFKSNS